jgi:putative endonuclease
VALHSRAQFGKWGEDFACHYLTQQGYTILTRNYRSAFGEIDIIVENKGEITFVEVKSRKTLMFGTPAAAVTKSKQTKIHSTAFQYLHTCNKRYRQFWFDVVEIYVVDGKTTINHIQHCF